MPSDTQKNEPNVPVGNSGVTTMEAGSSKQVPVDLSADQTALKNSAESTLVPPFCSRPPEVPKEAEIVRGGDEECVSALPQNHVEGVEY